MITLSRRNLIYLLARLEDGDPAPLIFKADGTAVKAEPDETHYMNYRPGSLADQTPKVGMSYSTDPSSLPSFSPTPYPNIPLHSTLTW
jgi:hypothetical protein